MKKYLFLTTILLQTVLASAQKFEWLTGTEGTTIQGGTGNNLNQSLVAADAAGNIYAYGMYAGTLILGNDTLNSYGNADLFLAKMDGAGNYLWVEGIGSVNDDGSLSFAVDGASNLYITCSNYLGGIVNTRDSAVATGNNYNLFCFDSSGSFRWIKNSYSSYGLELAASLNSTGVYLTYNAVIQKIDELGNFVWQKTATATAGGVYLSAIAVNDNNKLVFAASTSDLNALSGTFSFDTVNVPYPNSNNARLVFECDTSGSALWGKEVGGNLFSPFTINTVGVSNTNGEVYAGTSKGNTIYYFANDTVVNPVNPGEGWGAILKFSLQGIPQWARAFYAVNADVYDLVINSTDEIVLCGQYNNSFYGIFGPFNLPPSGSNPFIGKLSPAGNYMWTKVDPRTVNNVLDDTRNIANLPGNHYVVGGMFTNLFSPLAPYHSGCYLFSPGTYSQGNYFTVISENPEPVPVADFSILQSGNMVLFKNNTAAGTSASWTFGDATTSTQQQPIHTYPQPGVYSVSLTASNNCGDGMKTDTVIIKGIREIKTNHGTNNGVVTAEIFGGGFTPVTTLLLKKTGNPDITPFVTSYINAGRILVRFNFTGQTIGGWDVEVTVPSDTIMTLVNGFNLESPQPYSLEFLAGGSRVSRSNRWSPTYYTLINQTNTDAVGVPVMFRYNSQVTEFDRIIPVNVHQVPFLNSGLVYLQNNSLDTNVVNKMFSDTATSSMIAAFIIPLVKANSSVSLSTYVRYGGSLEFFNGGFAIYPMLESSALAGSNVELTDFCFGQFLKNGIESALAITISASQWNTCYPALHDSMLNIISSRANNITEYGQPLSYPACIAAMLSQLATNGCISGFPAVLTDAEVSSVISKTLTNIAFGNDLDSITANCSMINQYRLSGNQGSGQLMTNEFCDLIGNAVISPFSSLNKAGALFCKFFGNSVDPNRKSGMGDNSNDIFQMPGSASSYTIAFENLNTATAPAQVVSVIDTLDASRFDFGTFRFGPVTVGDSVKFEFDEPGFSQFKISSLAPFSSDYLRTEATFDTVSGKIEWILATVDPVNYQPDTNALAGFLPPNVNGTEGTGYVSYDIKLKSSLVTGDSVHNEATILFDTNTPIVTNDWLNVIDIIKPQSAVSVLPPNVSTASFLVSWSGTDFIAGVRSYAVYVSVNDQPYELWLANIDSAQYVYHGVNGNKYEFFSKATDRAGNIEDTPVDPANFPDAVTTVVTGLEEISGDLYFSLYPNPVLDELIIHSDSPIDRIKVSDVAGKEIYTQRMVKPSSAIRLQSSNFDQGIYFLEITSGHKKGVIKFIKVE